MWCAGVVEGCSGTQECGGAGVRGRAMIRRRAGTRPAGSGQAGVWGVVPRPVSGAGPR